MSHQSVPRESPTRVSRKSVPQECRTRVFQMSVLQECLLQECQKMFGRVFSSACVRSGSWVPSCFLFRPLFEAVRLIAWTKDQHPRVHHEDVSSCFDVHFHFRSHPSRGDCKQCMPGTSSQAVSPKSDASPRVLNQKWAQGTWCQKT